MSSAPPVPRWLWRAVTWGLVATLFGVAALATALFFGLADPPRAGPLLWQEDFRAGLGRWRFVTTGDATLAARDGALTATFTAPDQLAFAVTEAPTGDFTLEVAAAQTSGESGSVRYGLVFDWQDEANYSAVLVNGNGYVEVYRQMGAVREDWFPFAQWPHLLYGAEANRVRVDVRGASLSVRINDELLLEREAAGRSASRLGVLARSIGPGRAVFSWVKVWAALNR
ncbi:MAG: hypothetical protein RMK99_13935 [Anaerolineales bacterium]|nr:hypothetical protein [Anaerolineales bacterium]